jgi:hypothetical protein
MTAHPGVTEHAGVALRNILSAMGNHRSNGASPSCLLTMIARPGAGRARLAVTYVTVPLERALMIGACGGLPSHISWPIRPRTPGDD